MAPLMGPQALGGLLIRKRERRSAKCDMSEFEAETVKSELSEWRRRSRFEGAERVRWPVTRFAPLMSPPQLDERLMRKRERC